MTIMRRILFLLVMLTLAVSVEAHGYLIRSIPEDRAVLERPPVRLQYWFSEGLEAQFSTLHLRDQNGAIIASGGVDEQNDRLLTLRVPSDLPDGAYLAELRPAFASDSHVVVETRVFFVGDRTTEMSGSAASTDGEPLEMIWKALLYSGSYLLFGVAILYAFVLVPVWGSERYPAGLLPPRLMRRLNLLMWVGLTVTIAANLLALLQQTMLFFDVDAATAISGGFWQIVRVGSRFGDVWNFRMLALILAGVMQFAGQHYGRQYPRMVRSFWTANLWLLALLIGGQAVTSHAAGSLVMPWVAVSIHWLHTLAVAFWTGGVAALALVLPVALEPYQGESRWQALRPVMIRFSRYMVGALLLVITSGIYSASNWFYSAADVQTSYGGALGAKLLMMGLLLAVGGLHHVALRPHLLQRFPLKNLAAGVQGFSKSMQLETLLAIAALVAAAILSATPIPQPEFLNQPVVAFNATQFSGDLEVQAALSPGAPGVNTLDLVVRRAGQALEDATIHVQISQPALDQRTRWQAAEAAGEGLYVWVNDAIDQTGTWWSAIEIDTPDGARTRAAFAWELDESTVLRDALPPTPAGLFALLLVLLALGYVLYPSTRRLAQRMEWSMVNVVVSLGAILITVILIAASIWFLEVRNAELELQLNPPPQIINPVLPDAASLARGNAYFEESCAAWRDNADFPALIQQIDFLRDEELFRILERGWRDLPACENLPAEDERWHLVNALRGWR